MLLQWPRRGTTLSLVEAIADDVQAILERTGADVPPLRVSISGSSRPCQLVGDQIVLDEGLLGPDLHVGPDAARAATTPALALDRFRRATGLVAEGALIHAAAARIGQPVEALRDAFW
ncbi:MAG: hypothetical protein VX265_05710, partial [Myxococcota bacterium]|nr:hypothetical protein [Myxococcota bacterium]